MKKEELKNIIFTVKDIDYVEHPDEMDLTLFIEDKLDKKRREEIVLHLICCERCREIVASVANDENEEMEYANNPFFSKPLILSIISIAMVASIALFIFPNTVYHQGEDITKSINIELNLSEDFKYMEEIKSNCLEQEIEEAKKYYHLALKYEVGSKKYIELLDRSISYCYSAEIATHINVLKAQNSDSSEDKKSYLTKAFKDSYYIVEESDKLEQQIYIYEQLSTLYRKGGYIKEAEKFEKKIVEIQKRLKER